MTKGTSSPKLARAAKAGAGIAKSINSIAVLTETLDYLKVRTQEKTKREHIWAKRDVLIEALQSERTVILTYFEHRFGERKAALDEFYEILRQATLSGDREGLQTALAGILGILQDNPLKDFAEFRKQMADPNFVLEL